MLAFAGDLEKARRQIDAIQYGELELDAAVLTYRKLLDAEEARRRLFRDGVKPQFLKDPPEHVNLRLEALNRLREKRFLARHAIPLAPWRPVRTEPELRAAVAALGLPLILKTAASGYDGKGQVLVARAADAEVAWASLNHVDCVAEGWVEFAAEISVVAVRGCDGRAVTYPVGLNRHERHILDATMMPA